MRGIVNRMAGGVGDLAATLFAFAVLLLVSHAAVRLILGYGCGWWIPLWLLALHAVLVVLAPAIALVAYVIADLSAVETPETY